MGDFFLKAKSLLFATDIPCYLCFQGVFAIHFYDMYSDGVNF